MDSVVNTTQQEQLLTLALPLTVHFVHITFSRYYMITSIHMHMREGRHPWLACACISKREYHI